MRTRGWPEPFSLRVRASDAIVWWVRGGLALAIVLAAGALVDRFVQIGPDAFAVGVCAAAVFALAIAVRDLRAYRRKRFALAVDHYAQASLDGATVHVTGQAWIAAGLVSTELRRADGCRATLLLAAGATSDDGARRMRTFLRWSGASSDGGMLAVRDKGDSPRP